MKKEKNVMADYESPRLCMLGLQAPLLFAKSDGVELTELDEVEEEW